MSSFGGVGGFSLAYVFLVISAGGVMDRWIVASTSSTVGGDDEPLEDGFFIGVGGISLISTTSLASGSGGEVS